MMDDTLVFCTIDDFCQQAEAQYREQFPDAAPSSPWPSKLSLSEVMTLIILYQGIGGFRNFKSYYTLYICKYRRREFPHLVSYNRFVELMKLALLPLIGFLNTRRGSVTGLAFVDSTKLVICHNKRAKSNKVFKDLAHFGKSSMGWFYGFKLHLIINEKGEILACKLTLGNVDDRQPVPEMTASLFGKLFGDKGYISQDLFDRLLKHGLQLITPIKKNMKNKLIPMIDKVLLRKRSLIETVNDQLKNVCNIEHTRHRRLCNFMVNIVAALIAYTYREKLPAINFSAKDRALLTPID